MHSYHKASFPPFAPPLSPPLPLCNIKKKENNYFLDDWSLLFPMPPPTLPTLSPHFTSYPCSLPSSKLIRYQIRAHERYSMLQFTWPANHKRECQEAIRGRISSVIHVRRRGEIKRAEGRKERTRVEMGAKGRERRIGEGKERNEEQEKKMKRNERRGNGGREDGRREGKE